MRFCTKCGRQAGGTAQFCTGCGARLRTTGEPLPVIPLPTDEATPQSSAAYDQTVAPATLPPAGLKTSGRAGRQEDGASRDPLRELRRHPVAVWITAGLMAATAATGLGLATIGHGTSAPHRQPQLGVGLTSPAVSASYSSGTPSSSSASLSSAPGMPTTRGTTSAASTTPGTTSAGPAPVGPTSAAPTTPSTKPTTPPPAPSPSVSGRRLGGVDLEAYCQSLGYSGVELIQPNVYGWRCVDSNGSTSSISVIAACRVQYDDPTATANYSDFNDPDSWYCIS